MLQINWAMNDKQEFIDIVEVVYRGARKGRGLVVSPKGVHSQEQTTVCHRKAALCLFKWLCVVVKQCIECVTDPELELQTEM